MIGNGFNGQEVTQVLNTLQQQGIFVVVISEKLGTVTGSDGTKIKVNDTFLTLSPYLVDTLYIVGGTARNQEKFNADVTTFLHEAYKQYKPIGVATTGQSFIQPSNNNNLAGVVFAANNPNFEKDFVTAIGQMRFWNRR